MTLARRPKQSSANKDEGHRLQRQALGWSPVGMASERSRAEWSEVAERLGSDVNPDERRLLTLLRDGKTQPEIAAELGLHRSAVWRRVRALRQRAGAGPGSRKDGSPAEP